MSKDRIDVLAVEKSGGLFHVLYGGNELILYEGGCLLEDRSYFDYPYNHLAQRVSIPRILFKRLKNDIEFYNAEIEKDGQRHYDEDMGKIERRILRDERRLANVARVQGIDLREYFESYEGLVIG